MNDIAICKNGKIGIIKIKRIINGKDVYCGLNIFTNQPWQSNDPQVIARLVDGKYIKHEDS
jgi:hypothetical protein